MEKYGRKYVVYINKTDDSAELFYDWDENKKQAYNLLMTSQGKVLDDSTEERNNFILDYITYIHLIGHNQNRISNNVPVAIA